MTSSDKLTRDEFVPFAPAEAGAEVHVHHCKQGRNNDRLYIKREFDGSILAYCHHCGRAGSYNPARRTLNQLLNRDRNVLKNAGEAGAISLPNDSISNFNHWPIEARRWVLQYGITPEEVTNVVHLYYSPFWGRVILPTFGQDGKLLRWQGRGIHGLVEKANAYESEGSEESERIRASQKYHNKNAKGTTKLQMLQGSLIEWQDRNKPATRLCIVEDILSAIKVSRLCDALPLQGSGAKLKDLTWLKKYDTIVIYLDNDNNQVKTSQNRMVRALQLIVPNVVVVHADKDPKEQPMNVLEELINGNGNRTTTCTVREGSLPEVSETHKRDSD